MKAVALLLAALLVTAGCGDTQEEERGSPLGAFAASDTAGYVRDVCYFAALQAPGFYDVQADKFADQITRHLPSATTDGYSAIAALAGYAGTLKYTGRLIGAARFQAANCPPSSLSIFAGNPSALADVEAMAALIPKIQADCRTLDNLVMVDQPISDIDLCSTNPEEMIMSQGCRGLGWRLTDAEAASIRTPGGFCYGWDAWGNRVA